MGAALYVLLIAVVNIILGYLLAVYRARGGDMLGEREIYRPPTHSIAAPTSQPDNIQGTSKQAVATSETETNVGNAQPKPQPPSESKDDSTADRDVDLDEQSEISLKRSVEKFQQRLGKYAD